MRDHAGSDKIRTKFSELLRSLFTGHITNDEFEDAALELSTQDATVHEIYYLGARHSYGDYCAYRLVGLDAISHEDRKHVARWILFLKSRHSYSWPEYPGLAQWTYWLALVMPVVLAYSLRRWEVVPLGTVTSLWLLALLDSLYARIKSPDFRRAGDIEVWPFISKADYEAALKNPPYLCGVNRWK